jgi:hypothetical protein
MSGCAYGSERAAISSLIELVRVLATVDAARRIGGSANRP